MVHGLKSAALAAAVAALAGCGALPSHLPGSTDRVDKLQQEQFGSTTMHSRDFGAPGAATCEAARRALLSQGYVLTLADAEHVKGRKNFQADAATHLEIEFNVVCAAADRQGRRSIAFVNALQERFALKKSNNSASLGVGVLGSVSLPFTSSDDSMVRVASETIAIEPFYDRFFALVDRYLIADAGEDVAPEPRPTAGTAPKGAAAVSPMPASAASAAANPARAPEPAASSPASAPAEPRTTTAS